MSFLLFFLPFFLPLLQSSLLFFVVCLFVSKSSGSIYSIKISMTFPNQFVYMSGCSYYIGEFTADQGSIDSVVFIFVEIFEVHVICILTCTCIRTSMPSPSYVAGILTS
jgi:putative component of membrane protein insertase Oxa1/YidC/SpoIIIJ protein YidD